MRGLPRLYTELSSWWPVMSSPANYDEEAEIYREAIEQTAAQPVRTVLELGCGGGNNAFHLKPHYEMTLTDLAPGMLDVSRALNPECEHVPGDMRTIRLERLFDAVFIHDAIGYMATEKDLLAALTTAFVHCRPGGPALFVPDDTRETFRPHTSHGGHDVGDRSFRYLEWSFDPDPDDTETTTAFAYLMREGKGPVEYVTEEHHSGLFPRTTWLRLIEEAGFSPLTRPYRHSELQPEIERDLFLGLRAADR
jgi:SAM-dependent methyltransferase